MSEPLKVVAIITQAMFRNFQVDLARLLKERHGSHIILYTASRNAARFMRNLADPSPFDEIIIDPFGHPEEFPETLNEQSVIEKSREYEKNGRALKDHC